MATEGWVGCDTRCADDRKTCPARALVHVELHNGGELHYCGHHGDEYREGLEKVGRITDDRLADKQLVHVPATEEAHV